MRIGILTFHNGNNYGGILQCYALQQTFVSLGHSVEIINYSSTHSLSIWNKIKAKLATIDSLKSLYGLLKDLFRKGNTAKFDEYLNKQSLQVFDRFRSNYLNLSPVLTTETIGEYTNRHFDLIVVGSDQVWTPLFDSPLAYMIEWEPQFKGKRMSYAACSAYKDLRGSRKKKIKSCLEKFDLITVRDNTTQQLVNNVLGKEPLIVPDPSLLYPYEEFIKEEEREPYILTYILGSEIIGGHKKALDKIKAKIGDLPVYSIIIPCNSHDIEAYADKAFATLSPAEWVNLFYHASYVYTDSFHAIMFSLKFKKLFAAYYRNKVRSSRLLDLKAKGISCIYADADELEVTNEVYSEVMLKGDFLMKNLLKTLK